MDSRIQMDAGIDAESALNRMMGREALLERLFRRFLEDGNFSALSAAIEAGDREGALTASHTLKGMCGNLSMDRLYSLFSGQVDLMRAGDWEEAVNLMPRIREAYDEAVSAVKRCLE